MIRILHVDDSSDDRELIRIGLSRRDPELQITAAASVDEATETFRRGEFDCVICDFQMPRKNGTAFLRTLREAGDLTPFIFLTGQGNEQIAAEVFRSGADDYFTKEIGFAHYDRIVNSIRRQVASDRRRRGREAAEQRYIALFENIPEAVAVYEAVDEGRDFVFRAVNRAMEKIDQVHRDEIIGRRLTDVFPQVHDYGLLEVLARVWRTGEPALHPVKFYRDLRISGWRDNHVFRLPSGEVVSIYRDLTEQKLAENALKESEAKYRALFENAQDPIYLWEVGESGDIVRMIDVNGAAERLLGYNRAHLLKMLPADITATTHRDRVHGYVRNVVTTRHQTFRTEHLAANGRVVPVEVNSYAFRLGERQVVISMVRDISGREKTTALSRPAAAAAPDGENDRTIRELRQKSEALEATNRELEGFAYTVAHDVRAPLRRVHSYADLLLADHAAALDAEGLGNLQRIRQSVAELMNLVSHLLDFSRLTNRDIARVPVDLSAIARAVLLQLRHDEPGRSVETHVQEGIVGTGDPQLLRLLLENLIGNAWKYTGRREHGKIDFSAAVNEGALTVSVRDNGVGFNPVLASELFQPFRRLESAAEFSGTGIGLATAQRIVHRHGGSIWAEGREGVGATFCFTLP